jgi:uncharacterized membrane protein YeaQ/YmgE (transglycosylase-associated protein family)
MQVREMQGAAAQAARREKTLDHGMRLRQRAGSKQQENVWREPKVPTGRARPRLTSGVLGRREGGDTIMLGPGAVLLLLLIIGIAAGLLFDRFAGPGWLSRQVAGANRTLLTSALVGIAGSFVGYHLALVLGILGYGALIVAIIVALAVLWAWRTIR